MSAEATGAVLDVGNLTSPTLTSLEYQGLGARRNLSDGHAYHELPEALAPVVDNLPAAWHRAARTPMPVLERLLREAWAEVSRCPSLHTVGTMRICPTASNSIDLVGAACHALGLRVGLVEPTFDNLALLLRRRGVDPVPLPVHAVSGALAAGDPGRAVDADAVDVVFVVNPNNPTGTDIGPRELGVLARWCTDHGLLLVLDNTFRFYRRDPYDDFAVLRDAGVSFVAIEDSGKSWPTLDTKVSPLVFSPDVADLMNSLYDELYLGPSTLTLALITELLDRTAEQGLGPVLWDIVDERRSRLRRSIEPGPLQVAADAVDSTLSVEWLDCTATGLTDQELTAVLRERLGLHLLPGSSFYWSGRGGTESTARVRASLCRPHRQFDGALEALAATADVLR